MQPSASLIPILSFPRWEAVFFVFFRSTRGEFIQILFSPTQSTKITIKTSSQGRESSQDTPKPTLLFILPSSSPSSVILLKSTHERSFLPYEAAAAGWLVPSPLEVVFFVFFLVNSRQKILTSLCLHSQQKNNKDHLKGIQQHAHALCTLLSNPCDPIRR